MPQAPVLEQARAEALKAVGGEALSKNKVAREKLAAKRQKEGARKTMEDLRAGRRRGVEANQRNQAVAENILGGGTQDAKRVAAGATLLKINDYVEKGFNDPTVLQAELRTQVESAFQSTDYLTDYYNNLNPAQRAALQKAQLEDPHFQQAANRKFQERVAKRITDADKQTRLDKLRAEGVAGASWEMAAGQLEDEWMASIDNVVKDTTIESFAQNLQLADDLVTNEAGAIDAETQRVAVEKGVQAKTDIIRITEEDWAKNKDSVKVSFEALRTGGVEAVLNTMNLSQEQKDLILNNPNLKDTVLNHFATSLLTKKLRQGKLTRDEFYSLADAEWCGIDHLQTMVENHKAIQKNLRQYEKEGIVDRSFWDKVKGLSADKRKMLLFALLASLAMPAIGVAALGISGVGLAAAGGGANWGGAAATGVLGGAVGAGAEAAAIKAGD